MSILIFVSLSSIDYPTQKLTYKKIRKKRSEFKFI